MNENYWNIHESSPLNSSSKIGSIFSAFGWIIKIFVGTGFQIFVAGTYHNIMNIFIREPFETLTYEMASDQGHFVDEFTVLREIAINLGRTITMILAILIAGLYSIEGTFILGAVAVLLLNLLRTRKNSFPHELVDTKLE